MLYNGFQMLLVYAAIPALFSLVAIMVYPKWHDLAGFMWIAVSILKIYDVLMIAGILSALIGIVHLALFYLYKAHKLQEGPESKALRLEIQSTLKNSWNVIASQFKKY